MSIAAQIFESYLLNPMQQGMLYHALADARSGADIEQLIITPREPVDAVQARAAKARAAIARQQKAQMQ